MKFVTEAAMVSYFAANLMDALQDQRVQAHSCYAVSFTTHGSHLSYLLRLSNFDFIVPASLYLVGSN